VLLLLISNFADTYKTQIVCYLRHPNDSRKETRLSADKFRLYPILLAVFTVRLLVVFDFDSFSREGNAEAFSQSFVS
jgi:hypothetical protein